MAFDHLKEILTTAPVLAFPNYQLPFFLYVDASAYGLGDTLGQQQPNGSYPRDRNFSATEREALAVLDGIKQYHHYLYGRKFFIVTDHHSLKWLMNIKEPTGRLAHWSLEIQQYNLEINHRAGRSNGNADTLSGFPYDDLKIASFSTPGFKVDKTFKLQ